MKATLHIGLHRSLQRPLEGSHETNITRGGPAQLLEWAETQLGLNGPEVPWTDRVVAYHQRLVTARGSSYSRSLRADAWATASYLLRRRDGLLLAGWDPSRPTGEPIVDELGALEPFSGPPGTPDRIVRVLEWLERGLRLPEHTVRLDEDVAAWPPLWRRLLERLRVEVLGPPVPRGDGMLEVLQRHLVDATEGEVETDGSLVVLRAGSRHAAVQAVARVLRDRHATVHAEAGLATMLDAALHADGQPTMGAPRESRGQPAHQVLPLVLELLWEPVNPYVLLDFLQLPVGPVRPLAYHLSRALEEQPGYQSDAWNEAVERILEDDEDGKKAERIERWLDHERVPVGQDLPTALVETRCARVAQWAAGRAQHELEKGDDEGLVAALQSAASQASALGALAAQLGRTITEAQLSRLLEEVRSEASNEVPHEAQASGSVFVTGLADVRETELLVWVGPAADPPPQGPWTPGQVERLLQHGIELEPSSVQDEEIRGLCQARSLLIVDVPGEQPAHPLWLRIRGALAGEVPRVEEAMAFRSGRPVALPAQRASWELDGPLPRPAHTSATALEARLACPLKWTLRDVLGIRHGAISSIPEDQRLKGLFAHDLMEKVFLPGAPPTPDEAEAQLCRLFDELLPRNAAPLAIPRKLAERNRLRRELASSVRQFAGVLHRGGHEVVGIEVATEGEVDGVPLKGSIDCVLRSSQGESVVDFKLGGGRKREASVAAGRALQLATYAHSRGCDGAAYFILGTGEMITPAGGPLAGAPRTVEGPDVGTTWARFAKALGDASAWMEHGPVVARPLQDPSLWDRGVEAALDVDDPEGACAYCDYDGLCGRRRLA